jgi:hypothetical protein
MRRLLALVQLVGGPLLLLARRREQRREHVALHYSDGSMVTLEQGAPGSDRLLEAARRAL